MNPAVARGLDAATADGQAALVLTSDLPLVRPADLEWVLERRPAGEGATLVASRDGTGTNAMLLDPAWSLVPQLGVGSLARHLSQAARRHVDVHVHAHPRIGLDVDTPDDLAALWATGADCAARDVCARLEVGERLAAAGALG
jgi:2-phospho-L-lactate guanylyltransferase (CobY/MobA/RfbA family)